MTFTPLKHLLGRALAISLVSFYSQFGFSFVPVCDRAEQVQSSIEGLLEKRCEDITEQDLASISSLFLRSKNSEMPEVRNVGAEDFDGLVNVKSLRIVGFGKLEITDSALDELRLLDFLALDRIGGGNFQSK